MNNFNTPQLRICVTPMCNLSCKHCRAGGEGYGENLDDIMSEKEISKVLEIAKQVGFDCVKFTGGEPFIRKDILKLTKNAHEIGFSDIQVVTNGTLIEQQIEEIKNSHINMLTVSLDAIENSKHQEMRGINVYGILDNISKCRDAGINVRINMILDKNNFNQLPLMLNFAEEQGCSLKLLDLLKFEHSIKFWKESFLNFAEVRKHLENIGALYIGEEEAPGGIGAPLLEYLLNGKLSILLKDSIIGTYYHSTCEDCKYYPCQDALISVRVTHDGKLKRCLIRNDNMVDILSHIRNNEIDKAIILTTQVFQIMIDSKYCPYMFKV